MENNVQELINQTEEMTLSHYFNEFVKDSGQVTDTYHAWRIKTFKKHIEPILGSKNLIDLTIDDYQRFYENLPDSISDNYRLTIASLLKSSTNFWRRITDE